MPIMAHAPRPSPSTANPDEAGPPRRRVIILDGFAGPGVYKSGEEGSPLIALRTLLDHKDRDQLLERTIFSFVFFENDRARFASLEARLGRLKAEYQPWPADGVRIHCRPESFVEGSEWILSRIGEHQLAPIFAFIDPFGVSGLPMELIGRLSRFPKAEVFINFMRNTAQRFSGAGMIDDHFEELFGTDEYLEVESAPDRQAFLKALYERRLREVCGFKHVVSFEMVNRTGQSYDLFYGTRNLKGLEKMKDAMWKVDASGSFSFHDRRVGYISMFDGPASTVPTMRRLLLERFAGEDRVTVAQIKEFTLVDTGFSLSHWNKPMHELEKAGLVQVVPSSRRGTRGFPDGTIVRFA